ncbi:MAG: MBL fold metallo-hydrolase [Nitrospiraceae bacterium]|nr:MBL fold metallo-hydrolase [Nitrospiraceae bacterium]
MRIEEIVVGQLDVNCFVVSEETSSAAVVIDPGDEGERIAGLLDGKGLTPHYFVFTHAHYDHVCAAAELKARYGGRIVMHEDEKETYRMTKELCISWGFGEEDFPPADMIVRDGDEVALGGLAFRVIHTPGHTSGGICLYGGGVLFTGDTLFKGSAGRTDLHGGDRNMLLTSLRKLASLPPDTTVLCGHGDKTTIAEELKHNPFLGGGRFRMMP